MSKNPRKSILSTEKSIDVDNKPILEAIDRSLNGNFNHSIIFLNLKLNPIIDSLKSKLDDSRDSRRKRTKIDEFKEPVNIFKYILLKIKF